MLDKYDHVNNDFLLPGSLLDPASEVGCAVVECSLVPGTVCWAKFRSAAANEWAYWFELPGPEALCPVTVLGLELVLLLVKEDNFGLFDTTMKR